MINSKGKRWSLSFEREFPASLRNFCSNFLFSKEDSYELIMVDMKRIVRYSFLENQVQTLYKMKNTFISQPIFFEMRPNQTVALIASFEDVLLCDVKRQKEIDIDEETLVQDIRQVTVG